MLHPDRESKRKFQNLVLQCIKHGANINGEITKTKLAKLVYLCDFANYYESLEPISGVEYKKLEYGPVSIDFFNMIDSSESIMRKEKGRATMISLVEDPDDSVLSSEEMKLLKKICKKWAKADTETIVDFTHKQMPWQNCRDRETIPYELINMEEPNNVY